MVRVYRYDGSTIDVRQFASHEMRESVSPSISLYILTGGLAGNGDKHVRPKQTNPQHRGEMIMNHPQSSSSSCSRRLSSLFALVAMCTLAMLARMFEPKSVRQSS